MYEWLDEAMSQIKTRKFLLVDGPASAELRQAVEGHTMAVKPAYDPDVENFLRPLFQQYYTMSFDNYPVPLDRVHGLVVNELSK